MFTLQKFSHRAWFAVTGVLSLATTALAADPIGGDMGDIDIGGPDALDEGGIRTVIIDTLKMILDFLALAAVIFVVVAGIRLIISGGSDEQKDKAKKTILYVVIGLLIVLFARVIVGFFTNVLPSEI